MSEAHAIYSPSACYRNLSCKGSIALIKHYGIKGKPSKFAEEGTLAHDWIKKALETIHDMKHFDFTQIPDEEMREHVQNYCAVIGQLNTSFRKVMKGVAHFVEQKVKFDDAFWGTADYVLTGYNKTNGQPEAVICDFKYGRGVEVDAEDNEQLLCYALCLQKQLQKDFAKVHCFIYQPRTPGNPLARWSVDVTTLNGAYISVVKNKRDCLDLVGKPIEEIEANLCAGDHCRFCPAKLECIAFKERLNSTQLKILDDIPSVPQIGALTLEQKVAIFNLRKPMKNFIDEICDSLLQDAIKGTEIPGMKIVEGVRRRKWVDNVDTVGAKLTELGVSNPFKKSLIGIGEVEKQVGKGKLDDLTELPPAKYQLVPVEDKRAAIESIGIEELTEINLE
jgi:hypothetical protein